MTKQVLALATIMRVIEPGVAGDRAKGIPPKPPVIKEIKPGTWFVTKDSAEFRDLMASAAIRLPLAGELDSPEDDEPDTSDLEAELERSRRLVAERQQQELAAAAERQKEEERIAAEKKAADDKAAADKAEADRIAAEKAAEEKAAADKAAEEKATADKAAAEKAKKPAKKPAATTAADEDNGI